MLSIAQEAGGKAPAIGFDDVFWISVAVIFVVSIAGAFLRYRRRDRCLKLLQGFHATYLGGGPTTFWGDLRAVHKGLELLFDRPYRNDRGLVKDSALLYENEYQACMALCRTVHALSDQEKQDRLEQIERSVNPGPLRLLCRRVRNVVNTLKDAFTKTLAMFTGQISKTGRLGRAAASQRRGIEAVGEDLLGFVGNAYEALLERHIGKPVVLEIGNPSDEASRLVELPGYLAEYSDKFLAVFNVDHDPCGRFEIVVDGPAEGDGFRVETSADRITVTGTGPEAVVLRRLRAGEEVLDLDIVLLPGCSVDLPLRESGPAVMELETTRSVDIVCPRAVGRIRFGSRRQPPAPRKGWRGIAPVLEHRDPDPAREAVRPTRPPVHRPLSGLPAPPNGAAADPMGSGS